ncbi:MAG: HAMP domain-containing methyl-accepting chemotaxis protein [Alphaproteobacteria bacterium]
MEAAGIVMLDTVSLQALSIREYGGQGRTHFAIAALHRKPLATNTIGSMRENHGRVVHAWSLIEMVRDQMPPAVQAEIANLKSAYFETYANDRTQMYSSAASGNYPLDFDTFFSRSSAALGAAEKLADTAKDAMLEVARTAQTSNSLALLKETILAVIAGSVMMFMVWLLVFRISARVTKLNAMMGRLADGDLSIQPEQVASADEIGDMSRAVAVFKTNAERIATLKQDEALRDDMARREKERAMTELADGFERSVGSMVDTVAASAQKLEGAARSLTNAAEATTGRARAVSEAATAASGNVATVSTASEQLASSVREIGEQVAQSAQIAGRAVTEASTAGGQVRGLSEAAQKIGSIVSLINDIASKTNLLALNATIEAARAGEAGRGFAVVAQEVKGLAEQTSRATADISKQIEGIQHSTAATAGSISSIEKTIGDIHQIAVAISAAVEEQDAATQEIARNVLEAHAGSTTVSTTIQGVSTAAQDSTLASGEVLASARDLAKQADHMRNEIERFVLKVRSAA